MTVPTIAPIMTQQKSNMSTSCKYNKTKSNHFKKFGCFTLFLLQMMSQTVTFTKNSSWVC